MTNREIVESFYEAVGEKEAHGEGGVSTGDTDHHERAETSQLVAFLPHSKLMPVAWGSHATSIS